MIVAFLMQIVTIILSFVCRTIFANLLSKEYLGLSGLFTNIISVLSLSELGIGSVIIVNLYKPLANNDQEQICKLMRFYKNAYHIIGVLVILCGVVLTPLIHFLVKTDTNIPYLKIYFLMFILQAASSYFFSYKQALLTASQNEYICSIVRQIFNIAMNALQILFLLLTKNYFAYLIISILTNLGTNLTFSIITDKKFPFLRTIKGVKIEKHEKKKMFSNVFSMMVHKVGNVVINSTDNILISTFVGIVYAGLYSNYILIINAVTQVITIALGAVSASIGDFNAQKSDEEVKELYDALQLFSMWVFGMGAICFCVLFQPTIKVWLGEEFLLSFDVVLVCSLNFLFSGLFRVPSTFVDVTGLYRKTKFKPLAMAGINLAVSLILVHYLGLVGIFLGTLVCYLAIGIWVDPYYLYKYKFKQAFYKYWLQLLLDFIIIVVIGVAVGFIVGLIPFYIIKVVACGILTNLLFLIYLLFTKKKAFKYILIRIKGLFTAKKKKQETEMEDK